MKRVLQFFIIFVISLCFISPVHAQSGTASWIDSGYSDSIKAAAESGDINGPAHVSNVNTNTYSDFIRRVVGPVEGITINKGAMNTAFAQQMQKESAITSLSSYISAIYSHPPASTYAFVQDVGQTLGFIPNQAYAQGIGFSSLSPLLPVWKMFRNIAYALLAVIMLVVGFLVMFRKKIDPKTVVTIQSALPKIVISLILITFSYAIVGLMIDLMYVVMYVVVTLLAQASPSTFSGTNVTNTYINGNFGKLGLFDGIGGSSGDIAKLISSNPLGQGLSSLLVGVLISLAVLFVYVRILIMLISSYIQIIIALIVAPVQFLFDAIPGSTGGFGAWMKNFLSHLMVFPVTALLLMVGTILIDLGKTSGTLWTPPFLGMGADSGGITGIISIGIMLATPTIVKGLQEALKAKPMVNAGVGAVVGPIGSAGGQLMQLGYQVSFMKQALGNKGIPGVPADKTGGH